MSSRCLATEAQIYRSLAVFEKETQRLTTHLSHIHTLQKHALTKYTHLLSLPPAKPDWQQTLTHALLSVLSYYNLATHAIGTQKQIEVAHEKLLLEAWKQAKQTNNAEMKGVIENAQALYCTMPPKERVAAFQKVEMEVVECMAKWEVKMDVDVLFEMFEESEEWKDWYRGEGGRRRKMQKKMAREAKKGVVRG